MEKASAAAEPNSSQPGRTLADHQPTCSRPTPNHANGYQSGANTRQECVVSNKLRGWFNTFRSCEGEKCTLESARQVQLCQLRGEGGTRKHARSCKVTKSGRHPNEPPDNAGKSPCNARRLAGV
ncbi:hypothetical protein Bbelb_161970 [Branchiostoma belcheri]|nr:hypothetical protein Bbelb_161970 [Branchiostoma belcheri]